MQGRAADADAGIVAAKGQRVVARAQTLVAPEQFFLSAFSSVAKSRRIPLRPGFQSATARKPALRQTRQQRRAARAGADNQRINDLVRFVVGGIMR